MKPEEMFSEFSIYLYAPMTVIIIFISCSFVDYLTRIYLRNSLQDLLEPKIEHIELLLKKLLN